jgi:UDP-N-acetylmuramoylalanine--D-glutamate ligase
MMPELISSSVRRGVLGMGHTGRSVARYWKAQGIPFIAMDTRADLANDLALRRELEGVEAHFGEISETVLKQIDLLIASPGIAMDSAVIGLAQSLNIEVRGDIDLFVGEAQAPVIGITGSNGKSTVTTFVGQLLTSSGLNVSIGGNLGTPALELLNDPVDAYVLELSSFQLERAGDLNLAVAAVLNLSPDHLDRHHTMPLYHLAKHRIFSGAQHVVANYRDSLTQPVGKGDVPWTLWRNNEPDIQQLGVRDHDGTPWICFGFETLCPLSDVPVVGNHNIDNVLAALAICHSMGFPYEQLVEGIKTLKGLPHRCELVAVRDGVRFVNDSKGTNVGATVAALDGLANGRNIILIAGGEGKGQAFAPLAKAVSQYAKHTVLIGHDALSIAGALDAVTPHTFADDMESAVRTATDIAASGDVVLLSPACASLDMFDDYRARGDAFTAAVRGCEEVS